MNHLKLIMATVALTGLSVTAEATQQVKIEEHHPIVTKTKEPGWANVNCITLQDEFSTTNSGIMKFPVGKTVPVKASVSYSGDRQPISQSNVVFEKVDPALTIGYDPTTLQINGHKASFTFTVTLNQHLTKPALFTIKVADGSPTDNQHLTPYSQRQTVEEMLNVDEDNFTELPEIEPTDPTPEEKPDPVEPTDPTPEEKPDPVEPTDPTPEEKPDPVEPTDPTPEEKPDPVEPTDPTPEEKPDPVEPTDPTPEEKPDPVEPTDPTPEEKPDPVEPTDPTPEEKPDPVEPTDPTPDEMKKPQVEIEIPKKEEFPTVGESLIDVNTKNQVILPDMIKEKSHQMSLSGSFTPKNENNYEINNDNFSDNEKSLGNGISGQLPKTADKATPSFMYLGFTLIIFSIFGVRKLRNSEKQS
ncbi:LPXTG cell wall anchor domain-containing protein [Enterococcus hirae]|uniref:LPXTG cell wall anchor domain-containing protein n=1 Tax=Enterococcus hirae TaxID=1354 RepID=UPI001A0ECF56|nr:LPXTG cell wall anchor domain-containing protein [Enterococcus hirae]EMF0054182.1 LPXTG cell wall anchor domain-containing protein [Enterococcus hirae]EMF0071636.1 LPXTG cell wall anchor domain-containing protein [Enterococcus hirae]EMF0133601.1 LPXTG cell wall anchor domain-containing protein [Enterococcus hirae]EMF0455504.1 LPXTG cell wall anchor domain-containing protein [Enterococcus hirae]MBZ3646014.1 LPXTG cell wall anchor domain-containing protein [Enterococcus hirae]